MEDIEARLEAMEAAAKAATPGEWIKCDFNEGDGSPPRPLWGVATEAFWNPSADEDEPWLAVELHTGVEADATHIALNNPAAVLALVAGIRAVVADITAEKHEVVEDCWYTCGAATEDRDGGETCDDRRGPECDCGRDARVDRRLSIIASIWETP